MTQTLYASLRLRPTRIGFLVNPRNVSTVRRIMRLCCCLWGGLFNPIIPVSKRLPDAWQRRPNGHPTARQLTHGYVRFFEPDVYVEASPGAASLAGLDDSDFWHRRVVQLDDFASIDDGQPPEVTFGLTLGDLYDQLYEREYRFVPRREPRIAVFEGGDRKDLGFIEAAFGRLPDSNGALSHLHHAFLGAFEPLRLRPTCENWVRVVRERFLTPLHFTEEALTVRYPTWSLGPTLFVLDPASSSDLIDLWNLRLFMPSVLAVNRDWITEGRDLVRAVVEASHRPLPRNPHGVMMRTTLQFGRSIAEDEAKAISDELMSGLQGGSWLRTSHYDSIWHRHHDDMVSQPVRAEVTAETVPLTLTVSAREGGVRLRSLAPRFAEGVGIGAWRWINVLSLRDFGSHQGLGLVLPSHVEDPHRSMMRHGQPLLVSREGWVLGQGYKDSSEHLAVPSGREAVSAWLNRRGVPAEASDAGRIADEVVASVGGIRGSYILADRDTLRLLDKMAKSVRERRDGAVEEYADRTAPVQEWKDVLRRRARRGWMPETTLDHFVRAGALRLGLQVPCPRCRKANWYGLPELNTEVMCARCLQQYPFPQGSLNLKNTPWYFRVGGPYSVPDFAGGAYSTVLALRAFVGGLGPGDGAITYSTNLNLSVNGQPLEIDLALWYQRDLAAGRQEEPVFVVGEAKSFADDAISEKDVRRLRRLATVIPGIFLVVAVLKDELSPKEKARVGKLAVWGRTALGECAQRAPVIVLTGTELFAERRIADEWKTLAGRRKTLAEASAITLSNLWTLADCTQQVYLDLPAYVPWLMQRAGYALPGGDEV